jgi:hypothetical protein
VIIKSKRIRARGSALKRSLAHICDGEDNDKVALVRGNLADLEDARADALRFARQYCVRHWIASPAREISRDQFDDLIGRLAAEFEFDPHRVVAWEHTKDRATPDGCRQHFHILAPEVDPIGGSVMSSSHDHARHEKLARSVELAWGHAIVPGAHTLAVSAALDREGNTELAAALRASQPPKRPRQSFDENDHQRAKREGLDMPRLRIVVSEALQSSRSLQVFEAKLSAVGLRLRAGDKTGGLIVETSEGILVGSLARITRLRKEALAERLKFNAAEQSAPLEHSPGDLSPTEAPRTADGARHSAGTGGDVAQRAAPARHYDRTAAPGGERRGASSQPAGEYGSPSRRSGCDQGGQRRHSWMMFAGGAARRDAALDLLSHARRAALSPMGRAAFDLDSVIERETGACRTSDLPEPASLYMARRKVDEEAKRLRAQEDKADSVAQRLSEHPGRPILQRFFGPPVDPERQALEALLDQSHRKFFKATADLATARHALQTEERKFQVERARHQSAQSARKAEAEVRIATARAARRMLDKNPRVAFWGAAYLMRVAAAIQKARSECLPSEPDSAQDWDLVPILDLWGKPYLPPPKV